MSDELKRPNAESLLEPGKPASAPAPLKVADELNALLLWLLNVLRSPLTTIPGIILMFAACKEMWLKPDDIMSVDFITSNTMAKLSAGFGLINAPSIRARIGN